LINWTPVIVLASILILLIAGQKGIPGGSNVAIIPSGAHRKCFPSGLRATSGPTILIATGHERLGKDIFLSLVKFSYDLRFIWCQASGTPRDLAQPKEDHAMQIKKLFRRAILLMFIVLAGVLIYPFRTGKSLRDATEDQIVQQVPYVLDILAAPPSIESWPVRFPVE
jgi:hypothetical protein